MKRILLYSPDVVGHPRVYCRVIADALADVPCELFIALGFSEETGLAESPDLHPLAARQRVDLIDTRNHSQMGKAHLTAEELLALQTHLNIGTTLFIEADKSNVEFIRIAEKQAAPLRGRNLGIFAYTSEWYPGEDSFTGEPRRLRAPTLRTTLGNIKRRIFGRKKSAKYFYEKIIMKAGVLDEILVKDERLSERFGPPVYWMPEISRPTEAAETPEEAAEYDRRYAELQAFLTSNAGLEPVLYFGDAAYYKGYDLFLQFVATTPGTCAFHTGRSYDDQQRSYFKYDVEALREKLKSEGRLYETNDYVHTQRLKELYFKTGRIYLTTHRLALSSSTVIQAVELGKPVLVPDRGLLGHRIRSNNLGDVYKYEDIDDLRLKARKLWNSDLSQFDIPTAQFWSRFSDASVKSFFIERLIAQEEKA